LGTSAQDVLCAIRAVQAGELWAARKIVSQAYQQLLAAQEPALENAKERGAQLSPRQLEIVLWMRRGMTNKEIGRRLGISDMTVKTHAHNIFHKLEISGRMHLFGLPSAQQIAAPLEARLPEISLTAIRVLSSPTRRPTHRLNGDGPSAPRRATAEDHPPEPAAA
jgi:DNA-binding CsgD family transcriptional regulator